MSSKAVILVGGPSRGTRFRPLSMKLPKPLFPIAGYPIIYHHVSSLARIPSVKEILIIGFFEPQLFQPFLNDCLNDFPNINVRYLREYQSLGTGGGLYHFRDQILRGSTSDIFVMHADICSNFPLAEMLEFHSKHKGVATIMSTTVNRENANKYGCVVFDNNTHEVLHYVEKPETFVTDTISCGVYIFRPEIFSVMEKTLRSKSNDETSDNFSQNPDLVRLEQDVLRSLAGTYNLFVYHTAEFWRQLKSAGSSLPANKLYLYKYRTSNPKLLAPVSSGEYETGLSQRSFPFIVGDVFIHPTATVHPSAKLGPNVSIGPRAVIGKGVRIKESIVLDNVEIKPFACIIYSVIGWDSKVSSWARIEGSPLHSSGENMTAGKLEGSSVVSGDSEGAIDVNIFGDNVFAHEGIVIRNCIVLPHKELKSSFKNKILV